MGMKKRMSRYEDKMLGKTNVVKLLSGIQGIEMSFLPIDSW